MIQGILQYAHHLLKETISTGETVIDATCGNGHDTLFLSTLVGKSGHVLAFDVQNQAINNTTELLTQHNQKNITYIHDSHAHASYYMKKLSCETVGGAIFNLGYLPNSDKSITTKGDSTIQAVESILLKLKRHGLIVMVVYHGHEGGQSEKNSLLEYVQQLDQKQYHVLQYGFINQKNSPPFILAIEKK